MVKILLRQRLAEKGWSQLRLSQETGIRGATISHIYNEVCETISLEHIWLICKALDIDVVDLMTCYPELVARAERLARHKVRDYVRK